MKSPDAIPSTPRRLNVQNPGDESGIVAAWLLKVLVFIAAAGLVLIEVGGLLLARYSVADASEGAASAGALEIRTQGERANAAAAVQQYLEEKNVELVSLAVDPQARTVDVVVKKTAKTYVVQHIGALRKHTVATDSHSIYYGG